MILGVKFSTGVGQSLGSAIGSGKINNFDLIRFLAAGMVIVSHSFAIAGAFAEPSLGSNSLGTLAVYIFFIISGFLITRSWFAHPRPSAFIGKRLLRILPGLAGATLFVLLVIGPLFSQISLLQYFKDPLALKYLGNVSLFSISYSLPGVFAHTPFPNNVNGPIWTLPHEFVAYLAIIALGMAGLLKKRFGLIISTIAILMLTFIAVRIFRNDALYILNLQMAPFVRMVAFFGMGSLMYLYRDRIYLCDSLGLAALILVFVSPFIPGQFYIRLLALPYLVIYLAFMKTKFAHKFSRPGDFSYGMYIYAWPVQQSIESASGNKIGPMHLTLFALPIILILAALSWHFIEKPSLRLKTHFNFDRYPVQS